VKIDALQVTTDFAAWQGTPYAGAGTTHTYACGGSATCKPVALPSLDGYTLAGAYLGTLFLVDASSDVYAVQSSDLLAGTPEPVLLARGLPAFTKFVGSSSTTFYVLTSSGRIERTYPAGCGS
jgi:hypothetical protein